MTRLSTDTLAEIAQRLPVPEYDRSALRVGIVHFGVGGFHRAHLAMYLDRLHQKGLAPEWGICGVGLLPGDRAMHEALHAQNCLYTLVLKYPDGRREPRVIGSIVDYLFAPDDPEAVLARLTDPEVRIVSLTVTEGGYSLDNSTGQFDPTTPAVAHDLSATEGYRSMFGLITEALRRRRADGVAPFTVLSCDNIQGNGDVARRMFLAFCQLKDAELAEWMADQVAFPNSMVDRITPVTAAADIELLAEEFGVEDRWPVVCEPFAQWVVEDHFGLGRPAFDTVGAQMVDDVEPYELMKLRLLNAGHQTLSYFGYLMGYRLVHDACHDPLIRDLLLGYMTEEGMPTLRPVPGIDLDAYAHELVERFSNPEVRDTIARLAFDASERIPKWLLPVIRDRLAAGGDARRAIAVVASWARYCEGTDEAGEPIEIEDVRRDVLHAAALRQQEEPLAFLSNREVFGDLAEDPAFTDTFRRYLDMLHAQGARDTLTQLVEPPTA